MVKGFDKFKQYFAPHSDSFIVIGGTAMQLHGREGGLVPRVNRGEWQSVLDSLDDPAGNMEDYLLAFRRHFAL